jgi:hypothetical protein
MNARLYDPALGRFLSPDPYIQDPTNTQNYNRYSYVLNNPLRYTDPTGEVYSPYEYDWWSGTYKNKKTGEDVEWEEVRAWLFSTNSFMNAKDATSYLSNYFAGGNGFYLTYGGQQVLVNGGNLQNGHIRVQHINARLFTMPDGGITGMEWDIISKKIPFEELGWGLAAGSSAAAMYAWSNAALMDMYKSSKFLLTDARGIERITSLNYRSGWHASAALVNSQKVSFLNSVKWVNGIKWGGWIFGGLSTAISGWAFYENPNWVDGINTGAGVASFFFWPIGLASAATSIRVKMKCYLFSELKH